MHITLTKRYGSVYKTEPTNKKPFYPLIISCLFLAAVFCFTQTKDLRAQPADLADHAPNEVLVKLGHKDQIYKLKLKNNESVSQAISRVSKLDSVEYVEPNYLYKMSLEPLDTYYTQQIYLSQTKAHLAWNIVNTSPKVIIAILDTGVDIDHPDLKNNIWTNAREKPGNGLDDDKNGFPDDVHGWDFLDWSPDPNPKYSEDYSRDGMNHGTIVASIAAAQGGNQEGIVGVTWDAQIMPLRVLDSSGVGDTLHVARAIDYAVKHGADIINLSFVGDGASQTLAASIQKAWEKGVLVIAAAGNEVKNGVNLDSNLRYPICHDGENGENRVLGVASVDKNDRKASFSNFSHKYIDITAPGVGIFSALYYDPDKKEFSKYYGGNWAGTSVSVPQVSATAALIKTLKPNISLGELQKIIIDSGDNIDQLNKPWAGLLAKRLNVYNAMLQADESLKASYTGSNIVVSPVSGGGPHIRLFRENKLVDQFFSHQPDSRGGVQVAVADLEGDGQEEIITGGGAGLAPEVKIFDLKGNFKNKFLAYHQNFKGGVRVAVGDVDGDGQQEIIAGPGATGGPHLRIFDIKGRLENQFFVFNEEFRGGIEVATADSNNDGREEIIVGLGPGTIPGVRIYDVLGNFKTQFFAYHINFRGGVRVATADLNTDGIKEIITAPVQAGGPHVRIFNTSGAVKSQFFAFEPRDRSGLYITAGDSDNDGTKEIIVGAGHGRKPEIKIFDWKGNFKSQLQVYADNYRLGVRVAAGE